MTVHQTNMEPWKVTVVDTGYNTMTGGRIKRIQRYIENETFLMTYGDGVCDVEIDKLVEFHKSHGKLATLTAVKIAQDKGVLDITKDQAVRAFREKNASDGAPINAGYMVLEPEVFDMLAGGDSCVFEKTALVKLAQEGQLMSYIHTGFWQCMDNIREKSMLEKLLAEDKAPWKRWERSVPEIPDYANNKLSYEWEIYWIFIKARGFSLQAIPALRALGCVGCSLMPERSLQDIH